ncbi:hypothetical protein EXIGLDRAFT_769308 [Exidia glandulosa HHB12029]|uniref:Uncharacterized protein n=1 Tax=Exidia glandulosa HHB12029 TaxID=1314781 RepID=A0A165HKY1_EXIGL|nr:hypothetical protein EXIGLDRAFT_769308 [Exidia glandulosa HHB12029]
MGAMLGGGVGLTIGFLFGSYSIIRGGAGPRGFLATLSQYMLTSAASFSFFLAIGSVIRTEDGYRLPAHLEAAHRQLLPPLVAQRDTDARTLIRARWLAERQNSLSSTGSRDD